MPRFYFRLDDSNIIVIMYLYNKYNLEAVRYGNYYQQ